jgi:hypothetical protein
MKYTYQIICGLLVIILIIFLFKKCNNTPIKVPVVINPTLIRDTVYQESELSKYKEDSLNKILAYYKNLNNTLDSNLAQSDKDKQTLADTLEVALHPNKTDVNDFIDLSNKRDTICDNIVANQKEQLSLKDSILQNEKNMYDSLFNNFNVLATQSSAQSAYEKQLQPKTQLYIGGGLGTSLKGTGGLVTIGLLLKSKQDRIWKLNGTIDQTGNIGVLVETYFKIHK